VDGATSTKIGDGCWAVNWTVEGSSLEQSDVRSRCFPNHKPAPRSANSDVRSSKSGITLASSRQNAGPWSASRRYASSWAKT
jgi:hypothetical protein